MSGKPAAGCSVTLPGRSALPGGFPGSSGNGSRLSGSTPSMALSASEHCSQAAAEAFVYALKVSPGDPLPCLLLPMQYGRQKCLVIPRAALGNLRKTSKGLPAVRFLLRRRAFHATCSSRYACGHETRRSVSLHRRLPQGLRQACISISCGFKPQKVWSGNRQTAAGPYPP